MREETKAAIAAAKAASKISLAHFGGLIPYKMKSDNTPVTKIDRLCEKAILEILCGPFPEYSVLSEECGKLGNNCDTRWIIDPIDGTKAFMHAIPTFGNLIALEEKGKITIGVLTVPALGKIIWAEYGKGAFENGKRLHVSKISKLSDASILHGRGKGFLEKGYLRKLRNLLDSVYHSWGFNDPFAFYMLATGKIDAVIETFPKPWDVAAPGLIIEEAGGKFTDLNGKRTLDSDDIAIFSNGLLHNPLQKILRK